MEIAIFPPPPPGGGGGVRAVLGTNLVQVFPLLVRVYTRLLRHSVFQSISLKFLLKSFGSSDTWSGGTQS